MFTAIKNYFAEIGKGIKEVFNKEILESAACLILCGCCVVSMLTMNLRYKEDVAKMEKDLNDTAILLTDQYLENQLLFEELDNLAMDNARLRQLDTSNPTVLIELACEVYGVDPVLAVAISRHETGNYTSYLYEAYHNLGGMRGRGDYYRYNTLSEGVNAFVKMLKVHYIDKGMDTPEEMNKVYAESGSWSRKVRALMEEAEMNLYEY